MSKLTVRKILKSFNKNSVLTNVQLECRTGEILGIFGRNGTGKSTLLKILFGTLKADSEAVLIDSSPINLTQVIENKQIAYLPQDNFLPKDIKVRNIIPMYFQNKSTQDQLFYDHRIAKISHQKIATLSSGELRYLEILLVANLDHQFMLLDEPFSLIEPLYKEVISDLLTRIKQSKGIIVTDHYYRDVLQITDKNLLIKDGKIMEIKDKADLARYGYIPISQV